MQDMNEFGQPIGFAVPHWQVRPRPSSNQILEGKYCALVPLNIEKHAAPLFEAISFDNQGESWTYLPYGPCHSLIEFENCLKKNMSDKDTLLYAIIDAKTQKPVGVCGYLRINPDHGVIEVGHLHFSKLLQKTPAATEAMFLMMQYAFDDLGYRRYEWKCDALNEPSRKAALRFGFTFESIFRQCIVVKGRNRDTAWFSILDKEWPALKLKFKRWLDADNFDEHGKQRKSLQHV